MMCNGMGRGFVVLSLSLPLTAGGWLSVHWLSFGIMAPHGGDEQGPMMAGAEHHYVGAAPVLIAFAITLLLAGIALAIHSGLRRAPQARVPVWPIVLMSPLGFAVQEHLECLLGQHPFTTTALLDPTFLVGVALQFPFAVAAAVLARALSALGYALGLRLAVGAPRPLAWVPPPVLPASLEPELARPPILATRHGGRAPPAAALAQA
jgi:hypothetical protein